MVPRIKAGGVIFPGKCTMSLFSTKNNQYFSTESNSEKRVYTVFKLCTKKYNYSHGNIA